MIFAQLTSFLTERLNDRLEASSLGISGDGRNSRSDLTRL